MQPDIGADLNLPADRICCFPRGKHCQFFVRLPEQGLIKFGGRTERILNCRAIMIEAAN